MPQHLNLKLSGFHPDAAKSSTVSIARELRLSRSTQNKSGNKPSVKAVNLFYSATLAANLLQLSLRTNHSMFTEHISNFHSVLNQTNRRPGHSVLELKTHALSTEQRTASMATGLMHQTFDTTDSGRINLDKVTHKFIERVQLLADFDKKRDRSNVYKLALLGAECRYALLQLLTKTTVHIIVNGFDFRHPVEFESDLPEKLCHRVTILSGDALNVELIEANSLDGIFALEWMHSSKPEEIRQAFCNFANWLKPGGLLCLVVATPFTPLLAQSKFLPIYEERARDGGPWAGWLDGGRVSFSKPAFDVGHGDLFDKAMLGRETTTSGFSVVDLDYTTDARDFLELLAQK